MESEQIKNLRSHVVGHPFFRLLLQISQRAGAEVYLVGGLVRDRLLGRETLDWDLTLSQKALEIAQISPSKQAGPLCSFGKKGKRPGGSLTAGALIFASFEVLTWKGI